MEEGEGPRGRSSSVESAEGSSGASEDEAAAGGEEGALALLFERLMHECRTNAPGARLSAALRDDLERLGRGSRARLVSRTAGGAAPLFAACARGNLQAAQYLVQACGAPLEQRGVYRAPADAAPHRVTPLWAAAVGGRLDVLQLLAGAGAQLDAGSDSGSTPLRSACFMSHLEVARFLLARGADVRRANHNGGTCLVNAVQSAPLCELLLNAGAEVDAADSQRKTALHYAVQEHRADTVRLLLAHGADPRRTTAQGDDALTLACIKGATVIMHLLLSATSYGVARAADAHELLGATLLDEYNDPAAALVAWRHATALRHHNTFHEYIPKRPVRAPAAALGGAREWRSAAELDTHVDDLDYLRTQALLVATRILGPDHKDTLFRLMYRGASYADGQRYGRCVALWGWALQLRLARDTLLHPETCQTLLALTRLLLDVAGRGGVAAGRGGVAAGRGGGAAGRGALCPRRAALDVLRQVVQAVPESVRLVRVRPACRVQGAMLGRAMRCATHLVHVALGEGQGEGELLAALRREVTSLVGMEPRVPATGDSLLHLACSRLNVVRSTYFADEGAAPEAVFPSARVARLLLQCGADVARRNRARSTPLHVAAIPYNFSGELVETLLEWGAHLDQPNRFGDSPHELVALSGGSSLVCPLRHVTLACLAARAALRLAPASTPPGALPATLRAFLDLHRP